MDDIAKLRKRIDEIDDQILLALCERVKVCKAIGDLKKSQGMPIKDVYRENEVYKRISEKAAELGLDKGQVEAVYREIVNMCSAVQE
ncbi:MAG: chorismate mutase [Candidatus Bathyarchaeota archaeon]|nr:chorismate mutase [Candidatus Bathyarchaeota archaeon]